MSVLRENRLCTGRRVRDLRIEPSLCDVTVLSVMLKSHPAPEFIQLIFQWLNISYRRILSRGGRFSCFLATLVFFTASAFQVQQQVIPAMDIHHCLWLWWKRAIRQLFSIILYDRTRLCSAHVAKSYMYNNERQIKSSWVEEELETW